MGLTIIYGLCLWDGKRSPSPKLRDNDENLETKKDKQNLSKELVISILKTNLISFVGILEFSSSGY